MRVLFDGFWWVDGPPSNRAVAREILLTWHEQFPGDELVLCVRGKDRDVAVDVPEDVEVVASRLWPQALVNLVELGVLARRHRCDVILGFNFAPIGGRSVVFVHDLMFMDHPEWFSRSERLYFSTMPRSLRWAGAVATSSHAEAARIDRLLQRRTPVVPVGLGISRELITIDPVSPFDIPRERFALIVGRMNVRKNLQTVLRAAERATSISADTPLVVVGDDAYSGQTGDLGDDAVGSEGGGGAAVQFLGHISAANLKWLYHHANLTIYVPLDEGFGLPPIEAAWFGCPVVVSDIDVFHETTGGHAHFVDPMGVEAIAAAIDKEMAVARVPADRPPHALTDTRWTDLVAALRQLSSSDALLARTE